MNKKHLPPKQVRNGVVDLDVPVMKYFFYKLRNIFMLCVFFLVSCSDNNEGQSLNDIGITSEEVFEELSLDLSGSSFFEFNKEIVPLSNISPEKYEDPVVLLTILGRCSSIQMIELRFDDPNPDKRFEDMGFFLEKMFPVFEVLSPSQVDANKGLKSMYVHEYFIQRYNEILGSDFISEDRVFCLKFKSQI